MSAGDFSQQDYYHWDNLIGSRDQLVGGMSVAQAGDMEMWGEQAQDKWEHDVWLMARRTALLYYYLSRAIIEHQGEEEGRRIIKDAVWQYGLHCGRASRDAVVASGLEPVIENFGRIPDLPSRGWRWERRPHPDGSSKTAVTLCPLARTWLELGGDMSLARLYCLVDQAKAEGYSEDVECVHAANVLDGDPHCEVVFRLKQPSSLPE